MAAAHVCQRQQCGFNPGNAGTSSRSITVARIASRRRQPPDRAALAAYCGAYVLWADATAHIEKYGAMIKSPQGFPIQITLSRHSQPAGRDHDAYCFRIRIHPGQPQSHCDAPSCRAWSLRWVRWPNGRTRKLTNNVEHFASCDFSAPARPSRMQRKSETRPSKVIAQA